MVSETIKIPANGVELAYETFGDPSDVPILLIMGLGTQMVAWDEDFCRLLAGRGHFVIRFDNRDVGLSTHFHELRDGRPAGVLAGIVQPPYRLTDMAADAAALITGLGLPGCHIVGISMGGFIAQILTILRPELVRSLTSISSTTGSRRVGLARPDVLAAMVSRRPARHRDGAVAHSLHLYRKIGSTRYPLETERIRLLSGLSYDRCYDPAGASRQFAAILASPDRTPALHRVAVPTLVMHGTADPLVGWSGGRATAAAVPGARLVTFAGMGHDLPGPLWGRFVDEISSNVRAGEDRWAGTTASSATHPD